MVSFAGFTAALYLFLGRIDITKEVIQSPVNLNVYIDRDMDRLDFNRRYLDFVLKLFFAFGIAFEIPIAAVILILTGVTTPDKLASKRPWIIVGCFVAGMLLTPPDVISQSLLALPMWLLFELGILFGRILHRRLRSSAVT